MKSYYLLSICWAFSYQVIGQNVGIGTQTPHASAALDVSSTTRGLLAPRMTTAQRTAIAAPAKGLLVYDTDVNSLFHFNGSSWANLAAGGGGSFSLPFAAAVNLNAPTFQIENAGSGDVLFLGASSGSAINAFNTGNAAAVTVNATNGFGVYAQSFNSIPIMALSTNANNTLAAIRANNTGGGVGLHATASKSDAIYGVSTGSSKAGVYGEATGINGRGVVGVTTSNTGFGVVGYNEEGTGVYGRSTNGYGIRGVTNSGIGFAGVYGENTGTAGTGVRGVANFAIGIGVYGTSTLGTGVHGASNSGVGVKATSETNTALQAQSTSGTALLGNSTTGYALETSGKVKIAGGNTNPSAGAVLTSTDANGNAVWKPDPKVAFKVYGISSGHEVLPENAARRIQYGTESFDLSNNFALLNSGATPTANSSVFIAPVAGIYHFDIGCRIYQSNYENSFALLNDIEFASLSLMRNRNGVETTLTWVSGKRTFAVVGGSEVSDHASFNISISESLQAGDRIYLNIVQSSGTDIKIVADTNNWFSGVLVTPL
jgi:hypothetical protein